jgi:hypothetical protein
LRTSPAPRRIRPNQAPTAADRAQAAVTAQLLAELIRDCSGRIAAAAQAEHDALGAARTRQLVLTRRLRNELAELQAMDRRLMLRFQHDAPRQVAGGIGLDVGGSGG